MIMGVDAELKSPYREGTLDESEVMNMSEEQNKTETAASASLPTPTDPFAELNAMQAVAKAVTGLDQDAVARVLRWASERFNVTVAAATSKVTGGGAGGGRPMVSAGSQSESGSTNGNGNGGATVGEFTELGELYAAADPQSDADKALVVGYWLQYKDGAPDFAAQAINTTLKHMGYGIANITTAFDTLKARKPAHILQLKKAGTSRQARKTYKVTLAGKQAVEAMVAPQH
jgi:hypothetical protein